MPLIPFGWLPGHWGLKGNTRAIAKAEYELEGYDLEVELATLKATRIDGLNIALADIDLKYGKISEYERDMKVAAIKEDLLPDQISEQTLAIDLKYGKLGKYDYDKKIISLKNLDEKELKLANIKVEHDHGKITDDQYEKEVATIKGEPWVKVVKIVTEEKNPEYGSFEVDWNQAFIEHLHDNGYVAPSEDDVIDLWLTNLCRNIVLSGAISEEEAEYLKDKKVTKIKR